MSLCPCGSKNPYENCCGLYLEQNKLPDAPEQLMRSRYTAYTLGRIDYIKNTMKGKALIGFDADETKKSTQFITWIGLEVIQSFMKNPDLGFVEFSARFLEQKQIKVIHELSEFHKENGIWYYVDGITPKKINKPQIGRNSPCPCGSGKKFKNCHAR